MVQFSATIRQFSQQGDKTGWTYIEIPHAIAEQLKPGTKKSFRVKGQLDEYSINGIALVPMGEGNFILALNAQIRKSIGKRKGAKVVVRLQADDKFLIKPPPEFVDCLADEPTAVDYFSSLAKSHQHYFINWITSAKTEETKVKRIAQSVSALSKKLGFGEMIRALKNDRKDLLGK